ncbi:MAG: hypothetical protein K9K75_00725 [Deltaproteobacteria bacterium]|nr:hypothetical protein [Deltaproteobacteria bacterium]
MATQMLLLVAAKGKISSFLPEKWSLHDGAVIKNGEAYFLASPLEYVFAFTGIATGLLSHP